MPGAMFATADAVALHTIEDDDLEFLRDARNDPAVRRPLTVDAASNGHQTRQFFEDVISGDDGVNLLVCVDERGESTETESGGAASSVDERSESTDDDGPTRVGMVSLFEEDDVAGTATIAYWIVPEYWGNGYGTDAVGALCEHAFGDRRLHKLRADVLDSNDGSRRVLEKLGFEREGTLRDEKFVDGGHADVHRYGLLADEWGGR